MKTALKERSVVKPKREELSVKETPIMEKKSAAKEKPVVKEKPVQEIPESMGLCTTCNEAPTCVYAKNAKSPVLFCEMFDNSTSPAEATTPSEMVAVEQVGIPQAQNAPNKGRLSNLKGLCVNCDNRETCAFTKPEDGVWHCEEYR